MDKKTMKYMVIEFFIIGIPLVIFSPAIENMICSSKKIVQLNMLVMDRNGVAADSVKVIIKGIAEGITDNDGEVSFNLKTESPRYKKLGCSVCNENTEFLAEIIYQGKYCRHIITLNNDAMKDDQYSTIFYIGNENCQ